jgi:hypothetical protein
VAAGGPAEPAAGTFVSQLTFKGGHPYKFAHAAAHGIRDGLAQQVWLPEPLSAGGALNIKWPPSVLMACCRLGRVANRPDEEPFGFVICMLSAGAHCAVVGVDEIDDVGTGAIAALIVDRLRAGSARLDKALRDAQRVHQHEPLDRWALLATYVS